MRIVILSAALAMSIYMTQSPENHPLTISGPPQLASVESGKMCRTLAVQHHLVGRQATQLMPHLSLPGVEDRFRTVETNYRNIMVEGQHRGCGLVDWYHLNESNRWLM